MRRRLASWTWGWVALAELSQDEILRAMRQPEGGAGVERTAAWVLGLAGLTGLAYLGYRLVKYWLRTTGREKTNGGLFEELSSRHELTRGEMGLLRSVAERMELGDPAVLFVRKSLLEREVRRETRPGLQELMNKLFG